MPSLASTKTERDIYRKTGNCCTLVVYVHILNFFFLVSRLRDLLVSMGDRFTEDEVDEMFREAPVDAQGRFDYNAFTRVLKHGTKDE